MRKLFFAVALVVDGLMVLVFWNSWIVTIPVFFLLAFLFSSNRVDPTL